MPNRRRPDNLFDRATADLQASLDEEVIQSLSSPEVTPAQAAAERVYEQVASRSSVSDLLQDNIDLDAALRALQRSFNITTEQPSFGPPVTVVGPESLGIEPRMAEPYENLSRRIERAANERMRTLEVAMEGGLPAGRTITMMGGSTQPSIRETLAREAELDRELDNLGLRRTFAPGVMQAVVPMQVTYPLASDEGIEHTGVTEMPTPSQHNLITHAELSRVTTWETLKGLYVTRRRQEQASGLELLDHSPFYGTYMTKTYKRFYNTLMLLRSIGPREEVVRPEMRPSTYSTYSSLVLNETLHGVIRHDTVYSQVVGANDNRIVLSENAAKFLYGNNVSKQTIKECLDWISSVSPLDISVFVEKIQTGITDNVYYVINMSGASTGLFSNRGSGYYLGDNTGALYNLADLGTTLHADTLDTYNSICELRFGAIPSDDEETFRNELYETSFASPRIQAPHLLPFYSDRYATENRNFEDRSVRVAPRTNSGYSRTSMPTEINEHEQNWLRERRELQLLREQEGNSRRDQYTVDAYQILAYIQNAYRYAENITRLDRSAQQTVEVILQNFCQRVYNTWGNAIQTNLETGLTSLPLDTFTRHGFHFYNESRERAYCFRLKRDALEQTMVVGNRGPNRNRTRINREINARLTQMNVMLGTFGARITSRLHTVTRENGETKQIRIFILEGMPQNNERYTQGVNPIAERLRLEQTVREDSIAMPAWFTDLVSAIPIAGYIAVDEVQDIRPLESNQDSLDPNQWTVVQLPEEMQTYHAAAETIQRSVASSRNSQGVAASVQDYAANILTRVEATNLAMSYVAAAMAGTPRR